MNDNSHLFYWLLYQSGSAKQAVWRTTPWKFQKLNLITRVGKHSSINLTLQKNRCTQLVLSQRPGQRMPAAQLRRLAAALHARLFIAPRRPRPAGRGEGDASQYAVDLVRKSGKPCGDLLPAPKLMG